MPEVLKTLMRERLRGPGPSRHRGLSKTAAGGPGSIESPGRPGPARDTGAERRMAPAHLTPNQGLEITGPGVASPPGAVAQLRLGPFGAGGLCGLTGLGLEAHGVGAQVLPGGRIVFGVPVFGHLERRGGCTGIEHAGFPQPGLHLVAEPRLQVACPVVKSEISQGALAPTGLQRQAIAKDPGHPLGLTVRFVQDAVRQ